MTGLKNTHTKSKGSAMINLTKISYIFLHHNDCETPYLVIYIDLLSIDFNLMFVLWHYAYHQVSEIKHCTKNNMIAKYVVLSNIISVVSDNI